jgi:hypothetical protein
MLPTTGNAQANGPARCISTPRTFASRTSRLTLAGDAKVVLRARIGVGQRRWPTPRGEFYVRSRLSGPRLGVSYGPLACGTIATSDVLADWPGGASSGSTERTDRG